MLRSKMFRSLAIHNLKFSTMKSIDDDLFTYEVEVANIPCDSKMDNDLEHEVDDDMGYDLFDVTFTEWDVPWVDEKPWTNAVDYEWYEALEDSELRDEALRNKAIMEGFINEDKTL
ncbi:hypothetical protein Tco_0345561 [Tanacetum coccineum]